MQTPPSRPAATPPPVSATERPMTAAIQVLGKFVEALGRTNILPPNRK